MGDLVEIGARTQRMRGGRPRRLAPWTPRHFAEYTSRLIFDDGEQHGFQPWQVEFWGDVFRGSVYGRGERIREFWLLIPEGNGKTTLFAGGAMYAADYSQNPWIPVGAATRDQAMIMYRQIKTFVESTPGLARRFRTYDGYRKVRSLRNGGEGIVINPWDPDSNDGAIPFPFALVDEPHRHPDMRLYRLWKGKLRKRGAQIGLISTAGEPGTEFEDTRDRIRAECDKRQLRGARFRGTGRGVLMVEYMVRDVEKVEDMREVKKANPLNTISVDTLREDYDSPTRDYGEWKRLKCNVPSRSTFAAITDQEWEQAQVEPCVGAGQRLACVGVDVAWQLDTFAVMPIAWHEDRRVIDAPVRVNHRGDLVAGVLTPPQDGSQLPVESVKATFELLLARNPFEVVVMDVHQARDIASWLEDELGTAVVEWSQATDQKAIDYEAFMKGLRGGTLRHTGDPTLRRHAMNAIAYRLRGGRIRFDRPSRSRSSGAKQDVRVIDALDAAAMGNAYLENNKPVDRGPMVAAIGRR